MWNRFDSNFWYRFSSRIWYRFGSKLTRFCENFGTDLVPKFGTVFDSRVPKMLVHVFQKFWHLVSENVEPKGSRWWAGLMAAIIHSGCNLWVRTTSRQLSQLMAAAGRAALTNLLRVRHVRRLLISPRPRAWQSTCAANLRVRIPHAFWANAAAVVPRMLL